MEPCCTTAAHTAQTLIRSSIAQHDMLASTSLAVVGAGQNIEDDTPVSQPAAQIVAADRDLSPLSRSCTYLEATPVLIADAT